MAECCLLVHSLEKILSHKQTNVQYTQQTQEVESIMF